MHRHRYKSPELVCEIDVAPFVTVAMVLLIIFMVDSARPFHDGVSIDVPKVRNSVRMPRADPDDAMIVAVMRDGKIFFRDDQVGFEQLPAHIREQLAHGSERRVYIRADARARYRNVAAVLSAIRDAGIIDVTFFVDQRRSAL
jgi:biopolymer transport protein TolR